MVIDISKITLENLQDYEKIGKYIKGKHYSEFEKEIYKYEIIKAKKERDKRYRLNKKGDIKYEYDNM